MTTKNPVYIVNQGSETEFEQQCKELIELGYKLVSANCGFVNSEQYDFCSVYQAVFALPETLPPYIPG